MRHPICCTALIVLLASTVTVSGQINITATAPADTSVHPGAVIKQEVRTSFAQVVGDLIAVMFTDFRTVLGLAATPVDATTDPLSILEMILTNAVDARITQ